MFPAPEDENRLKNHHKITVIIWFAMTLSVLVYVGLGLFPLIEKTVVQFENLASCSMLSFVLILCPSFFKSIILSGEKMKQKKLRTREEVLADFANKGISIRSWALENRISPSVVHSVLKGKLKGRIGESHKAAVKVGLKNGEILQGE